MKLPENLFELEEGRFIFYLSIHGKLFPEESMSKIFVIESLKK